jgi:hypothetical protein
MPSEFEPYRERLSFTLLRTIAIALVVGAAIARWSGGWARWPLASLVAFWPSFGGHWVEIFFLNGLRPRLSTNRAVQIVTRLGVWFVGGTGLTLGMALTALELGGRQRVPWTACWLGGLAFIGIELVAHLVLQLLGRPSFYNGRG